MESHPVFIFLPRLSEVFGRSTLAVTRTLVLPLASMDDQLDQPMVARVGDDQVSLDIKCHSLRIDQTLDQYRFSSSRARDPVNGIVAQSIDKDIAPGVLDHIVRDGQARQLFGASILMNSL